MIENRNLEDNLTAVTNTFGVRHGGNAAHVWGSRAALLNEIGVGHSDSLLPPASVAARFCIPYAKNVFRNIEDIAVPEVRVFSRVVVRQKRGK